MATSISLWHSISAFPAKRIQDNVMTIIALSDTSDLNSELATVVAREIDRRSGSVAYISSSQQRPPMKWFRNTVRDYARITPAARVDYFDLSCDYSDDALFGVLKYGTIHLSGGNAFTFLRLIIERGFRRILDAHLEGGGLVVGVSSGSIILAPTIGIANVAGDKDTEGMGSDRGLSLLPFEFYPHYQKSQADRECIAAYSRGSRNTIYACADSDGLVIESGNVLCVGALLRIRNGAILSCGSDA